MNERIRERRAGGMTMGGRNEGRWEVEKTEAVKEGGTAQDIRCKLGKEASWEKGNQRSTKEENQTIEKQKQKLLLRPF